MKRPALVPVCLSLLALAGPGRADHPTLSLDDGRPGPLTTVSATTLPQGASSAGVQSQFLLTEEISDADLLRYSLLDEHVHSTKSLASVSVNAAYGVGPDLTAGFALPYLWRSDFRDVVFVPAAAAGRERPTPRHGGHGHEDDDVDAAAKTARVDATSFEGAGDAIFYGQYRFLGDEAATRHAALLFGLKTPTGRTDVRKADGSLIESDHQPGSGSWDPMLGFAFTRQAGRWSLDLNGIYTLANEGAQATNRGDIANYNLAVSYRLVDGGEACGHDPHRHAHGPKEIAAPPAHDSAGGTSWDLIFEANGDWRDQVRTAGAPEANTGGNVVFLSLGTRLSLPQGWTASVSAGLPAVSDLNGIQSEPRARLLFGVARAF